MGPDIESIESVDYNSIRLRWSKLQKEEAWEILRGYRIHIFKAYFNDSQRFYRKITVGPDVTSYYVTGLPTETYFSGWVTGFTAAGEGIRSHQWWISTSKHLKMLLFVPLFSYFIVYLPYKMLNFSSSHGWIWKRIKILQKPQVNISVTSLKRWQMTSFTNKAISNNNEKINNAFKWCH